MRTLGMRSFVAAGLAALVAAVLLPATPAAAAASKDGSAKATLTKHSPRVGERSQRKHDRSKAKVHQVGTATPVTGK